jgi:hypothetical protein
VYSPLSVSEYFNKRIREFYDVPPFIVVQFYDTNLGVSNEPSWSIMVSNSGEDWEPSWGSMQSQTFSQIVLTICREIEERFPDIKFPRA